MRKDIYRLQQERKDPLLFFRLKRGIIACCVGFVMFLLSYLKGMLVAGLLVFILVIVLVYVLFPPRVRELPEDFRNKRGKKRLEEEAKRSGIFY